MKYDYKVIELIGFDQTLDSGDFAKLQKWFDEGWEYVNSIIQPLSTGTNYSTKKSAVAVILRKESIKNPLD